MKKFILSAMLAFTLVTGAVVATSIAAAAGLCRMRLPALGSGPQGIPRRTVGRAERTGGLHCRDKFPPLRQLFPLAHGANARTVPAPTPDPIGPFETAGTWRNVWL